MPLPHAPPEQTSRAAGAAAAVVAAPAARAADIVYDARTCAGAANPCVRPRVQARTRARMRAAGRPAAPEQAPAQPPPSLPVGRFPWPACPPGPRFAPRALLAQTACTHISKLRPAGGGGAVANLACTRALPFRGCAMPVRPARAHKPVMAPRSPCTQEGGGGAEPVSGWSAPQRAAGDKGWQRRQQRRTSSVPRIQIVCV